MNGVNGRNGRDPVHRLPVELVTCIFDLLAQPDVLRVAGVSHDWRAIATANKDYYARLVLLPTKSSPWSADWELQVARFCNHLRRCRRRGVRTSIYLAFHSQPYVWQESWRGIAHECNSEVGLDQPEVDLYVDRVIPALKESMATVMNLVIQGNKFYSHHVYGALCSPAPQLEYLVLEESLSPIGRIMPLPVDLLAGHAPRLRTVKLLFTPIPDDPITAFANVPHVELTCAVQPPLRSIIASFTRPTRLYIRCGYCGLDKQQYAQPDKQLHAQPVSFGPRLMSLKISWGVDGPLAPDLRVALEEQPVPSVEVDLCWSEATMDYFLHHAPKLLALTFHSLLVLTSPYTDGVQLRVEGLPRSTAPDRYFRAFNADTEKFRRQLVPQLRLVQMRIAELSIPHALLSVFVRAVHDLRELRVLSVNVTGHVLTASARPAFWWPDEAWSCFRYTALDPLPVPPDFDPGAQDDPWPDPEPLNSLDESKHATISCPSLHRFELCNDEAARLAYVNRRQLVHFGRVLSLLRSEPSVTLCLKGVRLYGSAHVGLSMMFSEIDV
ncbi:hypothetical protein AURDEDRAFT_148014 [Auricularia subglabra TFB-10046 SS5]|nr:hypothetical protein AURDEDRAFT_148014 [Auricularia subglabra TFB-10046 SS5]